MTLKQAYKMAFMLISSKSEKEIDTVLDTDINFHEAFLLFLYKTGNMEHGAVIEYLENYVLQLKEEMKIDELNAQKNTDIVGKIVN